MIVSFDLETYLIRPGLAAPRGVCMSWDEGRGPRACLIEEGLARFWEWIESPRVTLVNQTICYDLAVLCSMDRRLLRPVWDAVDAGRVRCIMLREMLIANARGELKFEWDPELQEVKKPSFSLERLSWRYLGKTMLKPKRATKKDVRCLCGSLAWRDEHPACGSWRLHYAELEGVPIERWPAEAREYVLQDATDPRLIYLAQEEICPEIPGELSQIQAAWALALMRNRGVRTDPAAVAVLRADYEARRDKALEAAQAAGLVRPTGSKDMKAIQRRVVSWHEARGLEVPHAEYKGKKDPPPPPSVSTDRDALTGRGATDPDPGLAAVADLGRWTKVLSTNIPVLEHGTRWPVTPEYNTIIETIRTSCARPNIQNLPRKGGIRDCFIPRDGFVFAFCDYDTLEFRTLAQVCLDFGFQSEIAKALREGLDPHVELASELLRISPEEARARYAAGDAEVSDGRQFAKIPNYGVPGGMGPDALVEYARGYGVEITREEAVAAIAAFKRRWSEMPDYFRHCSDLCDQGDEPGFADVVFPRSGMVRGRVRYTAVCNGFFQHLAAMGAKAALARVSRECYSEPDSPLYGCYPWLFAHDEIGLEIPFRWFGPRRSSAAADRMQSIMVNKMEGWVPDVPIGATVAMARRWYKGAKPLRVDGMLVPCKPAGKLWVADL